MYPAHGPATLSSAGTSLASALLQTLSFIPREGSLQKRDRHERNPTTDADVLDLLIFYPEQFRRAF